MTKHFQRVARFEFISTSLLIVVGLIVIHIPMWINGKTLGWDAMRESWGDLNYGVLALSEGHFPFWNHLERGGYPFLADPQTAVLYPLTWILYLFGFIFGTGPWLSVMRSILHYFVAAYGCQRLAKHWGASRELGIFFAISYTLSGRLLKSKDNAGLWTMVWLPWLVMFVDRFIEEPDKRSAITLSFVLSLTFYAGYPPNLARSIVFIIPWALYRLFRTLRSKASHERQQLFKRHLSLLVMSATVTIGLCAPGLISTAQVLAMSERKGLGLGQILSSRFQLVDSLDIFLPRFAHHQSYALLYCGMATAILALAALFHESIKRRDRALLSGGLLLSILWTCGRHTPVLGFFVSYVPTFNLWRIAEQYAFLTTFMLSVLALLSGLVLEKKDKTYKTTCVDESFAGRVKVGVRELNTTLWLCTSITASAVLVVAALIAIKQDHISSHLLFSVIVAGACLAAMTFQWRKLSSLWLTLSLLCVFDIGLQQQDLVQISQSTPAPKRDHLVKLKAHQRFADIGTLRWRAASRLNRPELLGRYSTMVSKRWAHYRTASLDQPSLYEWGGVTQLFKRGRVIKFEESVPYAYLTQDLKWIAHSRELLKQMAKSSPKKGLVAFVEQRPASHLDGQTGATGVQDHKPSQGRVDHESVQVLRAAWGKIELSVNSLSGGTLVVNEAYSPWWRVSIDGGAWKNTQRMNYLFQGLSVSAGRHKVTLEYHETYTLYAMALSILTLISCLATLWRAQSLAKTELA